MEATAGQVQCHCPSWSTKKLFIFVKSKEGMILKQTLFYVIKRRLNMMPCTIELLLKCDVIIVKNDFRVQIKKR
jgi:hypothetical protein